MKSMSYHITRIFPSLKGLEDAIRSVDAAIISDEGQRVLRDKNKMKIVNKAIEKRFSEEKSKNGPIFVHFDKE